MYSMVAPQAACTCCSRCLDSKLLPPHKTSGVVSCILSPVRLQLEYGYKADSTLFPRGEDLAQLCGSLPESAVLIKHHEQQLLRPSPVLHLRLLIRSVLHHGNMLPAAAPRPQQDGSAGGSGAALRRSPSAGFGAAAAVGLDSVELPALTAAVSAAVGSSSMTVRGMGEQVAYPVVVVQQAFSKVFGYQPPLNLLGLENFKQLVQVRTAVAPLMLLSDQHAQMHLLYIPMQCAYQQQQQPAGMSCVSLMPLVMLLTPLSSLFTTLLLPARRLLGCRSWEVSAAW